MTITSVGFIGGGRVTQFLLNALQTKNNLPDRIVVSDPDKDMQDKVKSIDPHRIQCSSEHSDALNQDVLFLAVHPPVLKEIGPEIKDKINEQTIVISLVPVFTIEKLKNLLGKNKIVRMIPNAASLIHQGFNPVACSEEITAAEKQALSDLFEHWGEAPQVDEQKLEAFAIITAMGPTFFWPQWIKLFKLGKEFGLADEELTQGMSSMLQGAVELLYHSGLSAEQVKDLIPVYPLGDKESEILSFYDEKLTALYQKLTLN